MTRDTWYQILSSREDLCYEIYAICITTWCVKGRKKKNTDCCGTPRHNVPGSRYSFLLLTGVFPGILFVVSCGYEVPFSSPRWYRLIIHEFKVTAGWFLTPLLENPKHQYTSACPSHATPNAHKREPARRGTPPHLGVVSRTLVLCIFFYL